jgi:hypothetical protein
MMCCRMAVCAHHRFRAITAKARHGRTDRARSGRKVVTNGVSHSKHYFLLQCGRSTSHVPASYLCSSKEVRMMDDELDKTGRRPHNLGKYHASRTGRVATRTIFRQGDPASMSMLPHLHIQDDMLIRSRTGCIDPWGALDGFEDAPHRTTLVYRCASAVRFRHR